MRFGISATSWIFPKNFLTRLRPVNVCAMCSLCCRPAAILSVGTGATLRKAAIHRDYLDRRTNAHLLDDSGSPNRRISLPLNGKDGDSEALRPEITDLCL